MIQLCYASPAVTAISRRFPLRTTKMLDLGQRNDSGKFVTHPIQQWFRDLTTPVFLKLFANPKASDWIYSYRVDWEALVTTNTPVLVAKDR